MFDDDEFTPPSFSFRFVVRREPVTTVHPPWEPSPDMDGTESPGRRKGERGNSKIKPRNQTHRIEDSTSMIHVP